jgi:hypothetical protein
MHHCPHASPTPTPPFWLLIHVFALIPYALSTANMLITITDFCIVSFAGAMLEQPWLIHFSQNWVKKGWFTNNVPASFGMALKILLYLFLQSINRSIDQSIDRSINQSAQHRIEACNWSSRLMTSVHSNLVQSRQYALLKTTSQRHCISNVRHDPGYSLDAMTT